MINNNNHNDNFINEEYQHDPDPIIQERDESDNQNRSDQPSEMMLRAKRKVPPVTDLTLLSDGFAGTRGPERPNQSVVGIMESVFRFKWTIIIIFILMAAPLIASIWTFTVPKYRARAEVQVRPIIPFLVFKTEDSGMIPLYTSFINTQVSIMRSLTVLQRVLDQKDVQETQWYKMPPESFMSRLQNSKVSSIERLRDNLSVRPRRQTEIIDITFLANDAADAKLILDTVLEQYIKYIDEMSDATEDKLYRQLVDQYKSLENEIQGREKIVAEISRTLGTGTPEELISHKRLSLDESEEKLNKIQQRIEILEWKKERFALDGISDVNSPEGRMQSKYFEDAEWRQYDINLRNYRHLIEKSIYTDKHPEMIKLKKDMAFAEELLHLRESQLDEQWQMLSQNDMTESTLSDDTSYTVSTEGVGPPDFQMEQLKHEKQLLTGEVNRKREEFKKLFESAQLLTKENNELRHKNDLFDAVRQRLDQKNMERNVRGSIDVLMWSFVPSRPLNDRRFVYTAMAMAFSLCMGCGAAVIRASRNQVVYTPLDIPRPINLPLLGYIPLVNIKKSIGKALSDEIKKKKFLFNESVRFIRTSLLHRLESYDSATVLITSSVKGTGKSSFTKNLGNCMAQAGKDVLMIDTDIHKMTLTEQYDLLYKPGFINFLDTCSLDMPYIYATDTAGLSVMPAGVRSDDNIVFEDIAKGSFLTCINKLRQRYQIILLDCAPILPLADAAIMSNHVDGTILVERELVSHRRDVAVAIERLNSAGARFLGFAFVGSVDCQKYGYESYYYNP